MDKRASDRMGTAPRQRDGNGDTLPGRGDSEGDKEEPSAPTLEPRNAATTRPVCSN